jgi:hypothetical protein
MPANRARRSNALHRSGAGAIGDTLLPAETKKPSFRMSGKGSALPDQSATQSQAAEQTLADDQPGAVADSRARRTRLSDSQATVGFAKVRSRGLAKNLARAQTMFALANLYQFRRELLPTELRCGL